MVWYAEQNIQNPAGGNSGLRPFCIPTLAGFFIEDTMKKIPLTRGQFALVDDEDFEELSKHKWYVNIVHNTGYAHRQYRDSSIKNKKGKSKQVLVLMHRIIVNAPDGIEIDHIDGNGLNNQKSNLRFCTHAQNLGNQRSRMKKYKGVCKSASGSYFAVITYRYKSKRLGTFSSEISAAKAYDKAAIELFGEFANLNFKEKEI